MPAVILTIIIDVFVPVKTSAAVFQILLSHVDRPEDALVAEVPHEQLQSDQCKDAETEDSQDHHIRQLLHRLDESTHNGLQACLHTQRARTSTQTNINGCAQMHKHGIMPPHTFTPLYTFTQKHKEGRRTRGRNK